MKKLVPAFREIMENDSDDEVETFLAGFIGMNECGTGLWPGPRCHRKH